VEKDNIIVKMSSVTKTYKNGVKALNSVNIDIIKGDFVFIVGPTGTGKTTFLKLINREEMATGGEVIVDGQDVEKLSLNEVPYLRRKLGVIFQDFKLLPGKTCYENVAYALQVIGAGQREISYKVPRALESVGLEGKKNRYPDELSGGEKQRVAIARAFVNHPIIILADEPTGNLDPDTSWEITQLLMNLNSQGTTIIMATHDKTIVNRTRKRVIVLHTDGTVFSDQERGGYIHGL
jgi:cell division transport system ATP-binding protein